MDDSTVTDLLTFDILAEKLNAHPWLELIHLLEETGSTNDLALEAGRSGASEGNIWVADRQTKGRGRHGRVWESKPMGLWMSILLKPEWLARFPQRLTLMASVATARAIEEMIGRACSIKWPNDLMVDGKKLVGILVETAKNNQGELFAALGIGINLHQREEDFGENLRGKATSLIQLASNAESVKRVTLLASLLRELKEIYQQDIQETVIEWKKRCQSFGGLVRVQDDARTVEGVLVDIDSEGAALIRLSSGCVQEIRSGEIVSIHPAVI